MNPMSPAYVRGAAAEAPRRAFSHAEAALGSLSPTRKAQARLKLHPRLFNADPGVRGQAALALSRQPDQKGVYAENSAQKVLELLDDPEPWVRWRACSSLGALPVGAQAPAVCERLCALVTDPAARVRWGASLALGNLAHHFDAALRESGFQALLEGLEDPEPFVREAVLQALGQLGIHLADGGIRARLSVQKLLEEDPDPCVRFAAGHSLEALAHPLERALTSCRAYLAERGLAPHGRSRWSDGEAGPIAIQRFLFARGVASCETGAPCDVDLAKLFHLLEKVNYVVPLSAQLALAQHAVGEAAERIPMDRFIAQLDMEHKMLVQSFWLPKPAPPRPVSVGL